MLMTIHGYGIERRIERCRFVAYAAPVAAQTAERAVPKTVMDDTMTIDGIIMIGVTIVGLVVSSLSVIAYFEKKRKDAEEKADKRNGDLKRESRERDDKLVAEIGKHYDSVEKRLTILEGRTSALLRERRAFFYNQLVWACRPASGAPNGRDRLCLIAFLAG